MNRKGEFPLDSKVSARVRSSTKRLLKKLKTNGHTESDVIEYAARQLSKESTLLEWEIGEYDLQIHNLESELSEVKAKRQAKLNRLRIIAPKAIDEDVLYGMMREYAKEYASSLVNSPIGFSLEKLNNPTAKSSIRSEGEDCGYDPDEFLVEVRKQVKLLCQTDVSDI